MRGINGQFVLLDNYLQQELGVIFVYQDLEDLIFSLGTD